MQRLRTGSEGGDDAVTTFFWDSHPDLRPMYMAEPLLFSCLYLYPLILSSM